MTRSMSRWMLAGCMALAAVGAAAVLDVGTPAAEAAPSVSPFAGTYVGADPTGLGDLSPFTPFTVTISDGGRITSPFSNPDINGSVSADGTYSFTLTESGLIDDDGKLVALLTGRGSNTASHLAVLERN